MRLLKGSLGTAGALTDQYLFWMGESNLQKANYQEAGEAYARLLKDYPQSSARLAASYGAALTAFRLNDAVRSIALLRPADSDFQKAAAASTNTLLIARGYLLLAEAQMLRKDYPAARETLNDARLTNLAPEMEWLRQQLLTRLEISQDSRTAALSRTTNLVSLAQTLKQPSLLASAYSLQAEVFQLLEKPFQAAEAYDKILTIPSLPGPMLRSTLQRIVDMLSAQNQITNAIYRLTQFIAQHPQDPSLDSLHLSLGELQLKQFRTLANSTNAALALAAPYLEAARTNFEFVANQLTNSPFVGKALLNRGWVFWEQARVSDQPAKLVEGQAAFEAAVRRLPKSEDQATARFKSADCQYRLRDFNGAVTNYLTLLQIYDDSPQIKNALFDQVYYQLVRVRLDQNDLPNAADAVDNLLRVFPTNPLTEHALLLYAQALNENGRSGPARESLSNFTRNFPHSTLKPEAELALARTYVRERDWTNALEGYNRWLTNYTQHPARPQAFFDRAWVSDLAQQETNAFSYFTAFLTNFPTHPLASSAQNWVGNYYFNQDNWREAERSYQIVYENTNWPPTELTYRARLMAAKTAFMRQGYNDAKGYLTNLIEDVACPLTIKPEAYFMLGDVVLEQPPASTNALIAFTEAIKVFQSITRQYPTNRLTPLAWGKIGDCHANYAAETPNSYSDATNAYQHVLDWKATEVPVRVRNQADFGMGGCLEQMAKSRPPPEAKPILEAALDHYLNVVYGKNIGSEQPDPFWLKRSIQAAGRLLAEPLNRKQDAIQIYERARESLPSLKTTFDEKIKNLNSPPAANN
jgi:TolA-binding protein